MADGSTNESTASPTIPTSGLQFGWKRRLPVILQTEAAECGLACLGMIAGFHGHDVDMPGLRRRFSMSLRGVNLACVMRMAHDLGFVTRPLRLEINELCQLNKPCILHWDLNHFVVLKRITAHHVFIHDPSHGECKLTFGEFSDHFTGVALELETSAHFRPIKERQRISLRALTGPVKGLAPSLLQILILALALEVFSLVGPFYLQWVMDQALVSADRDLLTMLGVGFLCVVVFRALTVAARNWALAWLSATLNVQWAQKLFGHMLRLPLKWFETRHVGDVVSRFGSMHTIQNTMTTQFIGSFLDGLMSMVTVLVMGFYSFKLTLLATGILLLYSLLRWVFFGPLYRANEEHIVYGARQHSVMLESIRGALPIKLANKQAERQSRYANATVETVNRQVAIQRLDIAFTVINQLIFGIGRVVLIWIAAVMVLDAKFTVGMLVAFIAYADQFHIRAASLMDKLIEFRMLRLHAERLADIALQEPEPSQNACNGELHEDACIEVRNLSFRYSHSEPWVLRRCSFRLDANKSIAIVGPSGCGKTTLAKLVLGLLEPVEGEILFGGVDIRTLGTQTYRDKVGAVMQDDQLFAGTIADNIAFFDACSSQTRIEAAARLASVHEDIVAMPMGYSTLVGDMGSSLSGGQKQRVILARALYRRPRLLVLDEATSHLDMQCERKVNLAIQRLKLTRIVIAHRHETAASADQIIALINGQTRFVEQEGLIGNAEVGTARIPDR